MVQWDLLVSTVLILIQLKIGLLEQEHTTIHFLHHQLHLKLRKKKQIYVVMTMFFVMRNTSCHSWLKYEHEFNVSISFEAHYA